MPTLRQIFPYDEIRPQQAKIINFIKDSFDKDKICVIEASTGIGKTIAALSAVLEYIMQVNTIGDNQLKVVVVSRTHSQADRVVEELQKIQKSGMKITGLSKRGRKAQCINKEVLEMAKKGNFIHICESLKKSKKCKYFVNSFTRKESYVQEFTMRPTLSTEIISTCKNDETCPAEISNAAVKEVDVISCSYHYLFDVNIRERFLSSLDLELQDIVLIVDECHNLVDSVSQMNSRRISMEQAKQAAREYRRPLTQNDKDQRLFFEHICLGITDLLQKNDKEYRLDAMQVLKHCERHLKGQGYNSILRREDIVEMKAKALSIMNSNVNMYFSYGEIVADALLFLFDTMARKDQFIQVSYRNGKPLFSIKILDPAPFIGHVVKKTHNTIMMSGTIGNDRIFAAQNGLYNHARFLQLPSPYQQEIGSFIVKGITSKYDRRGPKMYENIINFIKKISDVASVNIGLYFTSYSLMNQVFHQGLDRLKTPILRAQPSMSSYQSEKMIREFKAYKSRGGAILCSVMGGRSSEGADFPGKDMEIVIIVGIPYPPQTLEMQAKMEYYEDITAAAWHICYATPAFRQINQTAGRAIRSLEDRALIFLCDERIVTSKNRLTGWLKSSSEEIFHKDPVETILNSYFDKR